MPATVLAAFHDLCSSSLSFLTSSLKALIALQGRKYAFFRASNCCWLFSRPAFFASSWSCCLSSIRRWRSVWYSIFFWFIWSSLAASSGFRPLIGSPPDCFSGTFKSAAGFTGVFSPDTASCPFFSSGTCWEWVCSMVIPFVSRRPSYRSQKSLPASHRWACLLCPCNCRHDVPAVFEGYFYFRHRCSWKKQTNMQKRISAEICLDCFIYRLLSPKVLNQRRLLSRHT